MAKGKNPAAVELGRKGGLAKTTKPKGLAALSKETKNRDRAGGRCRTPGQGK